jgi:hydrogenase-4 component B
MTEIISTYLLIPVIAMLLIPFLPIKAKGIFTLAIVLLCGILGAFVAIPALTGENMLFIVHGSSVTGPIPVRIDALSGWFILIINFTLITGALYGLQYMKAYKVNATRFSLHYISYIIMQTMLSIICVVQHSLVFLFAWELMALSSFILVIFEHDKQRTIKAGINYLIQAHLCILLLMFGFIWVYAKTLSFDFQFITAYTISTSGFGAAILFLCFFFGFSIKAGFLPFHTWLPYAHPAAPSHISGVMSGVIIKIGIYGILRMILLIHADYMALGYIILFISILSGIYGVMLAIIQHNLKKLLAYHSIENIGIIGIGIGLGMIGMGTGNYLLTVVGFAGAMLHVLNHSLFKSLLFYGAGNVNQAVHTMDIERMGGLGKKMPKTSILFLIAAISICGLPPFNGFVSEFLIYYGLFHGLSSGNMFYVLSLLFAIFSLVLIGGLAILCFTKAYGSIFLGRARHHFMPDAEEANTGKLFPMYLVLILMVSIGLFPVFFLELVSGPVKLFSDKLPGAAPVFSYLGNGAVIVQDIGWCAAGFILLAGFIYFIRRQMTANKPVAVEPTWGCGYVGDNSGMQYTASSFVRIYRKLASPLLSIRHNKKDIEGIFPTEGKQETFPYDKLEEWLIDYPVRKFKVFIGKFRFLQNGNPQNYVLYGVVFIIMVIGISYLFDAIQRLYEFLNHL